METFGAADTLHRLAKQALDSGAASTVAEAEAMLRRYRLHFAIGESEAGEPQHQAALLTGVALARRVFLGGVSVSGPVDRPLLVPLPVGATLAGAIASVGGKLGAPVIGTPQVTIGGHPQPRGGGFHIRAICDGWRGGIVPAHSDCSFQSGCAVPLAAMLSAALAINEAFSYVRGEGGASGRRRVGLSLWRPSPVQSWMTPADDEPLLQYLPSSLWLIGLGHLGQAYLWGLGLLPYANPSGLSLVLQDVDVVTPSTESTSILTDASMVGQKKTRVIAAWADRRKFSNIICERMFDASFRRRDDEPTVALCGLDNALGRRSLDQVGFDFVVEAGLGRGYRNFRTVRLHTLPGTRSAADIWKVGDDREDLSERPAYQRMLASGELDQCGVTLLAGKAVGAPFVGAVAACLALSEVLRLLHGGRQYQLIDLNLQSIEHRTAIPQSQDFSAFNPGYVAAG